jgi:hypothetical protein
MKKLLLLVVAMSMLFMITHAREADEGIDIIIVLDNSGSMRTNDRQRRAASAAMFLLDEFLLYTDFNFRYGFVLYDNVVLQNGTLPLSAVRTEERRNEIIAHIADSYMRDGSHTDTPLGLLAAYHMFRDDTAVGRRQFVVLLTDGHDTSDRARKYIDKYMNEHSDEDNPIRSNFYIPALDADVDPVRREALDGLAALGIPVIVIGFDGKSPGTPVLLGALDRIAARTNSIEPFIITDNDNFVTYMTQVRGFITSTIRQEVETAPGDSPKEQLVLLDIPDAYVSAATVYIFTPYPITITLYPPDTQGGVGAAAVPIAPPHVLYMSDNNFYHILQIHNPQHGPWQIRITGQEDARYVIHIIRDPRWQVEAEALPNQREEARLHGQMADEDTRTPITDAYVLAAAQARFYIYDRNRNPLVVLPASLEGHNFYAVLADVGDGDFYMRFRVDYMDAYRLTGYAPFTILPWHSFLSVTMGEVTTTSLPANTLQARNRVNLTGLVINADPRRMDALTAEFIINGTQQVPARTVDGERFTAEKHDLDGGAYSVFFRVWHEDFEYMVSDNTREFELLPWYAHMGATVHLFDGNGLEIVKLMANDVVTARGHMVLNPVITDEAVLSGVRNAEFKIYNAGENGSPVAAYTAVRNNDYFYASFTLPDVGEYRISFSFTHVSASVPFASSWQYFSVQPVPLPIELWAILLVPLAIVLVIFSVTLRFPSRGIVIKGEKGGDGTVSRKSPYKIPGGYAIVSITPRWAGVFAWRVIIKPRKKGDKINGKRSLRLTEGTEQEVNISENEFATIKLGGVKDYKLVVGCRLLIVICLIIAGVLGYCFVLPCFIT